MIVVNDKGLPFPQVRAALRAARDRDFTYHDGDILGSMCTAPDAAAAEAVAMFLETNLGDPGHFPGTRELERQVQHDLLRLAGADPDAAPRPQALLTSGGTESNLLAVAAAREAWRETTGRTGSPTVIVPETAHFSFEKSRRLTDTRLVRVATDEDRRVDLDAMADAIDPHTCLLVGVAGTTETGALDPIRDLARLAESHAIPLHVDAALGGFLLPFFPLAGREAVSWDFSLPGVSTITLDPHKMGTVPIPAGALLVRDERLMQRIAVETPYVTSEQQAGILGTRPGAAAAACWAAFRHQGRDGYTRIARECMELADHLRRRLDQHGIRHEGNDLNVVLIKTPGPLEIQRQLSERGWRVNAVTRLDGIRIVVMPHVKREHLDSFLSALLEVLDQHPEAQTPHAPAPSSREATP